MKCSQRVDMLDVLDQAKYVDEHHTKRLSGEFFLVNRMINKSINKCLMIKNDSVF